jgi:RNA polymerase sigma-70 factor (ECF subfamily)
VKHAQRVSDGFRQSCDASSSDHSAFATTHWSVVLAAGHTGSPEAAAALETLCRAYWFPLYCFARRRGCAAEDAQDVTQEFFVRLLANRELTQADRRKGRFRTFLLTRFAHFLTDEWRKGQAQKRGGGQRLVPFDILTAEQRYALEPTDEQTPERLYDRQWAMSVLQEALERLRTFYPDARLFEILRVLLFGGTLEAGYAAAAAEFGESEANFKSLVHRARQRYGALVRAGVADTVASPDQVDDELAHLLDILGDGSLGAASL